MYCRCKETESEAAVIRVCELTGDGGSVVLAERDPAEHTKNVAVLNAAALTGALGAFAILRKASLSFVMSVRLRMELLGSHWKDFHEILYLSIFFGNLSRKFKNR